MGMNGRTITQRQGPVEFFWVGWPGAGTRKGFHLLPALPSRSQGRKYVGKI